MPKNKDEINPFVQTLEIKGMWKLYVTGEQPEADKSYRVKLIDVDERCSFYTEHMMSWFPQLSTSAKDMVLWISAHLGWNSDIVTFDEERYCADMKVSRGTYFNARSSLINRLIIPRTSRRNTYWVNPAYLFKGNRVHIYPNCIKPVNEHPLKKVLDKNIPEDIV